MQAIDRAHRIGQTRTVRIFRLITRGSIEERILTRAQQKLRLDTAVVKSDKRLDGDPDDGLDGDAEEKTTEAKQARLLHARHVVSCMYL